MFIKLIHEVISDLLFYDGKAVTEIRIEYPSVEGYVSRVFESSFNMYFERRARLLNLKARREVYSDACAFYRRCNREGLPFSMYSITQTVTETLIDSGFISLYITVNAYSGGAHGQESRTGETWAMGNSNGFTDGSKVDINRLLKIENPRRYIIDSVTDIINADKSGKYFGNAAEMAKSFDMRNFYLTEKGLVVFYPPYILAPYYTGTTEFEIKLP